jgi:surfactin synthase thioesterase subunit
MIDYMSSTARLSYDSPYIRRTRRPGAQHRLFCLPHPGAGAGEYATWAPLLPPEIEIVAIQLPGREDRINEPAFTEATQLIPQVVQVLRPYIQLSFSFFGHSGSALLAFELTRALRVNLHREPEHLFVSGQAAPHLTDQLPVLHTLTDTQFIEAVYGIGGMSQTVLEDPQLKNLVLPALRADFTMWERHRPNSDSPLAVPITAFAGDCDKRAPADTLQAWRHHTTGPFKLLVLEGDHFFVRDRRTQITSTIGAALKFM